MDEKKAMLEAALFVADKPLDSDQIMDALNLGSPGYVQTIIDELRDDLAADDRGLELIGTEEGYQLQVKTPYVEQVKHLAPHQDLGDATLRTLSLIAYNAPVKQSRVIEIRGNRAYRQIRELEDRNMVTSRKDGRTKVLDVTDDFLEYFGLDNIQEFRRQTEGHPASEELVDEDEEDDETGDGADTDDTDVDDTDDSPEDGAVAGADDDDEEIGDTTREGIEDADTDTDTDEDTEADDTSDDEGDGADEDDDEDGPTTITDPVG